MKAILVPTDFSKPANNALTYALAIANKSDAKIVLLHVYHLPASNNTIFRDVTSIMKQDADALLQNVIKQVQADPQYASIILEPVSRKGDLVTEVDTMVAATHADLIVMGTKGASGLAEIFMGTNTASVIEQVDCPVLAVPEFAEYHAINRILYAADYQAAEDESILLLTKFAAIFNASILLTHVSEENIQATHQDKLIQDYAQRINQKVSYPNISYRLEESVDVLNGLNNTIQSMNIDLVAMTTRKRNLYQKLIHSSITKKMAYHTNIPLLAFHA